MAVVEQYYVIPVASAVDAADLFILIFSWFHILSFTLIINTISHQHTPSLYTQVVGRQP